MNNAEEEEDLILSEACDAWALARTPGELAEAADSMFLDILDVYLLRMRDAFVKEYDKKRAERAEHGLPPLEWSKDDPLPEAGTMDGVFIRTAESMRGLNREILKRQAEKHLGAVKRAELPAAHIEAIEAGLSDSAANRVTDGETVLAELRQLVSRDK